MKLIIFDIDGTIIDSIKSDDACYVQTLNDLFDINLSEVDWAQFKNVTDSGLTYDIFQMFLKRPPKEIEILEIKKYYYGLLVNKSDTITEITGAEKFINYLNEQSSYKIAFATGGWKMTALLKSGRSNIDITKYIYKTADDHYNRVKILQLAISESMRVNKIDAFESITSIGDGIWDKTTAEELGVDFIGIDYHENGRLKKQGAKRVIKDYKNINRIMEWL